MAQLDLSEAQLSRALSISQSTVNRWTRGAIPQPRTLAALADALRCRIAWLLSGQGDPPWEIDKISDVDAVSRIEESQENYKAGPVTAPELRPARTEFSEMVNSTTVQIRSWLERLYHAANEEERCKIMEMAKRSLDGFGEWVEHFLPSEHRK